MRQYDVIFVAAVVAALIGVVVVMLRQPALPEPAAPRRVEALPPPPPPPAVNLPPQPEPAALEPVEQPVAILDEPPEEPAPEPQAAPPEPEPLTPQQMILGSWTTTTGQTTVTLTFYEDGGVDFYVPGMPPEFQDRVQTTYTWESDDRLTMHMSVNAPDGRTTEHDMGITIVSLTEHELVLINDMDGREQTFTR